MKNSEKVKQPHKNFVKIMGQLLYTEEQLQAFQKELEMRSGNYAWWLGEQLKTGELSSFTIYAPKYISREDIIKEAFDMCSMNRKEEYKFKLAIQSREEMWFEDLPYEMQKKFGVCYRTTLSYLPGGIKCWKRWGRRSWDMLVPKDFPLDRGRRVQWEVDQYFETWQIAKDTFFGNESETLKLRRETIAKEKEAIRLVQEQKSAAIRSAHQTEIDEYNEKYRLYRGETKEEYYKHPFLGEVYIDYSPKQLYTEEILQGAMRLIDMRVEEKRAKEEAEANRKIWEERINTKLDEKPENGGESLRERASNLGYDIRYCLDSVDICQSCYCRQSIKYSEETVFLINQFVTQKELELQMQQEAERLRLEYEKQQAEAQSMGLPSNIEIWHRVGCSTNCGEGWVVKPDGSFRDPTKFEPKKLFSSDGYKNWEQILPGEVVLSWGKGNTAAEHEFQVIYMPNEGLTAAQKDVILHIEEDIQEQWKDKRGMSSGLPSPDVGMGWNICGRKVPLQNKENLMLINTLEDNDAEENEDSIVDAEEDRPIEEADLTRLLAAFGCSR